MTDTNVPKGEKIERRGARPGPRRGPPKEQFTIRLTAEERDYLVGVWGWVQAGISALLRRALEGRLAPLPAPKEEKKKPKKGS
jgi:hypothetical protein